MNRVNEIRSGFETAYIDGNVASSMAYKPQFLSNNYKEGKKVISSIEDELLACDQFQISVAFITMGGNHTVTSDVKRTGKEAHTGKNFNNQLFKFQ